jgi:hypothetical protein
VAPAVGPREHEAEVISAVAAWKRDSKAHAITP